MPQIIIESIDIFEILFHKSSIYEINLIHIVQEQCETTFIF